MFPHCQRWLLLSDAERPFSLREQVRRPSFFLPSSLLFPKSVIAFDSLDQYLPPSGDASNGFFSLFSFQRLPVRVL